MLILCDRRDEGGSLGRHSEAGVTSEASEARRLGGGDYVLLSRLCFQMNSSSFSPSPLRSSFLLPYRPYFRPEFRGNNLGLELSEV